MCGLASRWRRRWRPVLLLPVVATLGWRVLCPRVRAGDKDSLLRMSTGGDVDVDAEDREEREPPRAVACAKDCRSRSSRRSSSRDGGGAARSSCSCLCSVMAFSRAASASTDRLPPLSSVPLLPPSVSLSCPRRCSTRRAALSRARRSLRCASSRASLRWRRASACWSCRWSARWTAGECTAPVEAGRVTSCSPRLAASWCGTNWCWCWRWRWRGSGASPCCASSASI